MDLSTQERFLIIAQHPEKGRFVIPDLQLYYGIVGAILLDLTFTNEIRIENNILVPSNKSVTTNKTNQEVLSVIRKSSKQYKLKSWISKLAQRAKVYKWAIIKDLELKNMIRVEHRRFLGIIPYRQCFLIDKTYRQELLNDLRSQILFKNDFRPEDLILLGLVEACQLHRHLAQDRNDLKTINERLKTIVKDNPISIGVEETIRQVQAAVIANVVAATTAAAAASAKR